MNQKAIFLTSGEPEQGACRRARLWFLFFAIAWQLSAPVYAQSAEDFSFRDGDRVCFVGNSITNNGQFHNFINLYYATRFPERRITFFNCGISGNTAADVLKRMDVDILVNKPTWAVVMLGMNDVSRSLYDSVRSLEPGIDSLRMRSLNNYRKRMEQIINILLSHHSKVILQKPTIYDQTGTLRSPNNKGVNDALGKCAVYIDELAAKYHLLTVDYWTILGEVNKTIQKKEPSSTIIGPDRVHPRAPGHFIMAYKFLKSTLPSGALSAVEVNYKRKTTHCSHCTIRNYGADPARLSFSVKSESLPYPVPADAEPALQYIPFVKEYDQQNLRITRLKKGDYDLYIDSVPAGKFSHSALNAGINLAVIKNTPQYRKSQELLSMFTQYREYSGHLRMLKFVEFDFLDGAQRDNMDSVRLALDRLLQTKYADSEYRSYYKEQFDHYLAYKTKESELQQSMDQLLSSIYEKNRPQFHLYEVVKRDD